MPSPAEPPGAGLGATLRLASRHLPAELVGAHQAGALAAVASALPPVHFAGFECRLSPGDHPVDFQQGLRARQSDRATLARFLRTASPKGPSWAALQRLSDRWCQPGNLVHDGVAAIWLEVDTAPPGEPAPASGTVGPSVIVLLGGADIDELSAASAIGPAVLHTLTGEEKGAWDEVLQRCAAACPAPGFVSHIGVMLSRRPNAMRLNITNLRLEHLKAYLAAIGWPGDGDEAERWARQLLVLTDRVVVCLDVTSAFLPRIGLECFFARDKSGDPRWRPLLGQMVAWDRCTREKADALMRWPGRSGPLEAGDPWPEDLLVQSIRQPVDRLGVVDRRLSHLKLTVGDSGLEAKAYFGFEHIWLDAVPKGHGGLGADDRAQAPGPAAVDRSSPAPYVSAPLVAGRLEGAMARAVDHLVSVRNQGGWWHDFAIRAGAPRADGTANGARSDEWVTAYIATALARAYGAHPTAVPGQARAAAAQALELLLARRPDGAGWGYSILVPPDADSTTWVLHLATALGLADHPRFTSARDFVAGHVTAAGAVATYGTEAVPGLSEYEHVHSGFAGWRDGHGCVTAAAASLDFEARPQLLTYLVRAQGTDGGWAGYWWDDDEYTTALACEALAADARHAGGGGGTGSGDESRRPALVKAARWAARRLAGDGAVHTDDDPEGSAFATALALRAVATAPSLDGTALASARRALKWLTGTQRDDGSWAGSARLRIPDHDATDPNADPSTTVLYTDDASLFTTATVVASLSSVLGLRLAPVE